MNDTYGVMFGVVVSQADAPVAAAESAIEAGSGLEGTIGA